MIMLMVAIERVSEREDNFFFSQLGVFFLLLFVWFVLAMIFLVKGWLPSMIMMIDQQKKEKQFSPMFKSFVVVQCKQTNKQTHLDGQ